MSLNNTYPLSKAPRCTSKHTYVTDVVKCRSTKMSDNNRHQVKCDGKVNFNLSEGIYKNTPSVFEDLKRLGCWSIEEEDKCKKWLCTYDFEAIQWDFDDKVDDMELLEEGTRWNKIHVTVSFSIGCNLDGVEMVHVLSKDPGELLSKFEDVLMEIAEKKYAACIDRYDHIFMALSIELDCDRTKLERIVLRTYTGDDLIRNKDEKVVSTKLLKELESVDLKFESYCMESLVFGFNSAGYDVKLVMKYLFKELCRWGESPSFTVKKGGKYPCIKTSNLKFLDILQFLAPGYNLKSFFKAIDANEENGFFPMITLLLLINSTKLHFHPMILSILRSKAVMFSKRNSMHIKNFTTEVK